MNERFTFRKLRESKRLDVSFLARQFGVAETQIQEIEWDSAEVSYELLDMYLNFFEISYDDIYFGKEAEFRERQENFISENKEVIKLEEEKLRI